jgi:hypothetical protein
MSIKLVFNEYFDIEETCLDQHGALNICLDADLPLFIDPFLLFASDKKEYQQLHDNIVGHLIRLKEIAIENGSSSDRSLFKFPEIKQNWLGMCKYGNNGKGLGEKFAKDVISAFNGFYSNFGQETITEASHIEKLTLVSSGIGKDFISDFTTNLMFEYLLEFTQDFALKYLKPEQRKTFSLRCVFDKTMMVWRPKKFELPYFYREKDGDFVLLTPLDILTKDDSFISHSDLVSNFRGITSSIGNDSLRNAINSYFYKVLPPRAQRTEVDIAISRTISEYPEILDYYVRQKEDKKDQSKTISKEKIEKIRTELISNITRFCEYMMTQSDFFEVRPNSYEEALKRAIYLKEVIEDNDGYRIFYKDGKPIASEDTIQRIFRLTWYASPYDVNSEVNNGRGPADYKVSFGSGDSTIVEFKLGRSSSLKTNLKNQTEIYKKASKSISDIKVILCYSVYEVNKVKRVLKAMGQESAENVVIIDGSPKLSASVVK